MPLHIYYIFRRAVQSERTVCVLGSACFRCLDDLDGYAQFSGSIRQVPIERHQRDVDALRDREVQRIRHTQPEIKSPNIHASEANIDGMDFRQSGHRRSPHVEIGQTRLPVARLEASSAN